MRERLRSRIVVQVDGGFRTGRDVVIGALLGADEFGFATAPLIAAGCIMMRKCHLNTCPVGVATQDPVLRKRFTGQPEHVINYFFFVAEEVREIMAQLGYRKFDEMVGQTQMLDQSTLVAHWKAKGLDFSKLFVRQKEQKGQKIYHAEAQNHHLEAVLDRRLIEKAQAALDRGAPVKIEEEINNTDRSAGAMLSGTVAKIYGHAGLPHDTIQVSLKGTAGQAFGAWLARGVTFDLEGEGNDYVGKGLSGGRIIVKPPRNSGIVPEESIIVGNTVMYGAIEGECYFRGIAGERFAVRNSGAIAVVEGAGDHCCEYMTGGIVVVLGKTGRNFAAGMSGGIAYVLDEAGDFAKLCNMAMVELEPVLSEEMINAEHLSPHRRSRSAWPGRRVPEPARLRRRAAARPDHAPRQADRLEEGRRDPRELEDLAAEIPQGDAGGIPPRAEGNEGERRRRAENRDRGLDYTSPSLRGAAKQSIATTKPNDMDCFVARAPRNDGMMTGERRRTERCRDVRFNGQDHRFSRNRPA